MKQETSAGIIAAGEGSRFKKSGVLIHKPLIPVAGFPLIGYTLKNFEFLGIQKVAVIFNESGRDCADWVKENFPRLRFEIIVKSTKSSFESFWLVGERLGAGRHLISTVDAFCDSQELKNLMVDEKTPGIVLGVTSVVDDEKPLWVRMDEKTKLIRALGVPSGRFATAGVYNVPSEIFLQKPEIEISSLRKFLKWLVEKGTPARGVILSRVVDVDMPKDIAAAEKLLKSNRSS
jgi:NDP-sugar pyrophosphorylase family protein